MDHKKRNNRNRRPQQDGEKRSNRPPRREPRRKIQYRPRPPKDPLPEPPNPNVRLNRYIANAGICSRREADDLIANGMVEVNGEVVKEMGFRVKPEDEVRYKGKVLMREKPIYVLLNKPKNVITTTDDPRGRQTVLDLVEDAGKERIYPVGRLDRNTTGLLLLTNDGDLAERLTHPSYGVPKIYRVELDKPINGDHFEEIQNGIELEDGKIKPDAIALVSPDAKVIGIEIHSGRNRIVRRIFEHFGYQVEKLDRTVYANLSKGSLRRGSWRFLKEKEVIALKVSIGKKKPKPKGK
ncbi:MAG: pseudouridine synthase [Bacteroidota bacterium]